MIVWGGSDDSFTDVNTGGRYDPSTDSWILTTTVNAPSPRGSHTAVWTGTEMIVWGGSDFNTGGRYNAGTDSWTSTTTANAPAARGAHSAVWTGSEMIIWGLANYPLCVLGKLLCWSIFQPRCPGVHLAEGFGSIADVARALAGSRRITVARSGRLAGSVGIPVFSAQEGDSNSVTARVNYNWAAQRGSTF